MKEYKHTYNGLSTNILYRK